MSITHKPHTVQVIMNGYRYVATERAGKIELSRDGNGIGIAQWEYERNQLIHTPTTLPDDACFALEKKLKERIQANWDED